MKKSFSLMCSVFLLAVAGVTGRDHEELPLEAEAGECLQKYFSIPTCPVYDGLTKCFGNIHPSSDEDRTMIKAYLIFVEDHKSICPALNTENDCVWRIKGECTSKISHMAVGSDEFCSEVPNVLECLRDIDVKCQDDSMKEEIEFMRKEGEKCPKE